MNQEFARKADEKATDWYRRLVDTREQLDLNLREAKVLAFRENEEALLKKRLEKLAPVKPKE